MWTSMWHTKTMLKLSFKLMYLLKRLLMLLPAQDLLPLYWSLRRTNRKSECISITVCAVPKQCQFKKYKNCFVLMQLHLMLKIFACDVWLALWIFFEKFYSYHRNLLQSGNVGQQLSLLVIKLTTLRRKLTQRFITFESHSFFSSGFLQV